jgi:hypothetical protein
MTRPTPLSFVLGLLLAARLSGSLSAQVFGTLGSEFQVNTYNTSDQHLP